MWKKFLAVDSNGIYLEFPGDSCQQVGWIPKGKLASNDVTWNKLRRHMYVWPY